MTKLNHHVKSRSPGHRAMTEPEPWPSADPAARAGFAQRGRTRHPRRASLHTRPANGTSTYRQGAFHLWHKPRRITRPNPTPPGFEPVAYPPSPPAETCDPIGQKLASTRSTYCRLLPRPELRARNFYTANTSRKRPILLRSRNTRASVDTSTSQASTGKFSWASHVMACPALISRAIRDVEACSLPTHPLRAESAAAGPHRSRRSDRP